MASFVRLPWAPTAASTVAIVGLVWMATPARPDDVVNALSSVPERVFIGEREWEFADRCAGKPCAGLVAEPVLVPRQIRHGDRVSIVLSIKNLNDRPVSVLAYRFFSPPMVRDESGQPARLTRKAREELGSVEARIVRIAFGPELKIPPGFAMGVKYPLDEYCDFSDPGRYTAMIVYSVPGHYLAAKPVSFTVPKQEDAGISDRGGANSAEEMNKPAPPPASPFEAQRQGATLAAGRAREGLTLEAVLSPVDPRAVNLVVSLTNTCDSGKIVSEYSVSYLPGGSADDAVPLAAGISASEYLVYVLDASGNSVSLTREGRNWLATHSIRWPRTVRPGEAVGFVFPLHKMFELQSGHDYAALVCLRSAKPNAPGWASNLVRFRAPERPIPGVTRPRYGSDRMWPKLMALAASPRTDVVARAHVRLGEDSVDLRVRLENHSDTWLRAPLAATCGIDREILLVRDGDGAMIPPNSNAGQIFGSWAFSTSPGILHAPVKDPSQDRSVLEGTYPLHLLYHLEPASRYTVMAGYAFKGDVDALVLTNPVTFTAPLEPNVRGPREDDPPPGVFSGAELAEVEWPPVAKPRAPAPAGAGASVERDAAASGETWQQFSRFAGKPFEGMALSARSTTTEAAAGEPIRLDVSLNNVGDTRKLVKTWHGDSGFDILVRDAADKPVPLTEKGKAFFESRTILDVRYLRPGEAMGGSLRLDELFAIQAPGEYTILASLPVLGDADAVYTAAPIKLRITAASVSPKEKKAAK